MFLNESFHFFHLINPIDKPFQGFTFYFFETIFTKLNDIRRNSVTNPSIDTNSPKTPTSLTWKKGYK